MWTWSLDRLDRANRAVEKSAKEVKRSAIEARQHRYAADIRQAYQLVQNGQGPKLNPHPAYQGIEYLCNPPGRGLGRRPTGNVNPTFDGHTFNYLDAFLWTGTPGRSHNSDCPGGPWQPAGVFDTRFALELAQHANRQLGPRYPGQPY